MKATHKTTDCVDNALSLSYRNFVLEIIKKNTSGRKKEMSTHKMRKTFRDCRENKLQLKRLRDTLSNLTKDNIIEKSGNKTRSQSYIIISKALDEKQKKKNTSVKKKTAPAKKKASTKKKTKKKTGPAKKKHPRKKIPA